MGEHFCKSCKSSQKEEENLSSVIPTLISKGKKSKSKSKPHSEKELSRNTTAKDDNKTKSFEDNQIKDKLPEPPNEDSPWTFRNIQKNSDTKHNSTNVNNHSEDNVAIPEPQGQGLQSNDKDVLKSKNHIPMNNKSNLEQDVNNKNMTCICSSSGDKQENNSIHEKCSVLRLTNSMLYIGSISNHQLNGIGKLLDIKNEYAIIYRGYFSNSNKDIYGFLTTTENNENIKYEGEFHQNELYGIGIQSCKDKYVYIGEFNTVKSGIGSWTYKYGRDYSGEWLNNKKHGFGIYRYENGNIYSGQFESDIKQGYGEYIWRDGRVYYGYYRDNKRNGFGVMKQNEKEIYLGFWSNDQKEGIGKTYHINKSSKVSLWINNMNKTDFMCNDAENIVNTLDLKKYVAPSQKHFLRYFSSSIEDLIRTCNIIKSETTQLKF